MESVNNKDKFLQIYLNKMLLSPYKLKEKVHLAPINIKSSFRYGD